MHNVPPTIPADLTTQVLVVTRGVSVWPLTEGARSRYQEEKNVKESLRKTCHRKRFVEACDNGTMSPIGLIIKDKVEWGKCSM
jgi:hypothetical protein